MIIFQVTLYVKISQDYRTSAASAALNSPIPTIELDAITATTSHLEASMRFSVDCLDLTQLPSIPLFHTVYRTYHLYKL